MNILGISCYYHDAAACLVQDGVVTAAAQEERFTRKKNTSEFPLQAINYCLQAGAITVNDIDYVAFYEKPYLKFARVLVSHLRSWPFSLPNFLDTMPQWLQDRLIMPLVLKREIGYEGKVLFVKHHLSHAASSYLVSPFDESAILTADSVGEWATTTTGVGRGNSIRITKEMHFPDSLGLLYTAVTTYLGFEALEGEGKVMGLAAYGTPRYLEDLKKIVRVNPDGSFRIDRRFFGFNTGRRMYGRAFVGLFGPERRPEGPIEERHCDIAASLQKFTEEAVVLIARELYRETKMENLCLAGGLFLNCVANSRIQEEAPFKRLFIQPASGDSGGALGAASYVYHSLLGNARTRPMADAYLGPSFTPSRIRTAIINAGYRYAELADDELFAFVARKILENKTVGWFQGRMEFGPRALGNRSILANPCDPSMKDVLNDKVKHREPFRPFAPVVAEEKVAEYFEFSGMSPFMLLSPNVREDKRNVIPAVTHKDGTARLQTVSRTSNPRLWRLIGEFEALAGVPVFINTSFNLKGEPIVCSPEDAVDCFRRSALDCLVLENYVLEKP